jgi:predicted xylose isomerase-like sugar epimerase
MIWKSSFEVKTVIDVLRNEIKELPIRIIKTLVRAVSMKGLGEPLDFRMCDNRPEEERSESDNT